MKLALLLSRARFLALALPLYALVSSVQVGCGSVVTNDVGAQSAGIAYGTFGRDGDGHYGYYGYYGCTDGYGYDDPIYGYGCDDGKYYGYDGSGDYGYGGYGYGYGYGGYAP